MRVRAWVLTMAGALALFGWCAGPGAAPAAACSCTSLRSQALGNRVAEADAAIVGHLRDGQAMRVDGSGGAVDRLVDVDVDEVVRGTIDRSVQVRARGCLVDIPAGAMGMLLTRWQGQWQFDGCASEGIVTVADLRAAPWRAPPPVANGAMTAIVAGRFGEAVVAGLDASGHVVRWGIGAHQAVAISACDGHAIATVTEGDPGVVEVRALPSLDVIWRRELTDLRVTQVPWSRRDTSIACVGDGSAVVVAERVGGAEVVRSGGSTVLQGVAWVAGGVGQVFALNGTGTELSTVDVVSSAVARRATMPAGLVGQRHAVGPDGTIAVLAGPAVGPPDAASALVLVPPSGDDHEPIVAKIDVAEVELVRWLDGSQVELSFGHDPLRQIVTREGTVGPLVTAPPERVGLDRGVIFTAGATPLIQTSNETLRRADGDVVAPTAAVADVLNLDQPLAVPRDLPAGTSPPGSLTPSPGPAANAVLTAPIDPSRVVVVGVVLLVLGLAAVLLVVHSVRRRRG